MFRSKYRKEAPVVVTDDKDVDRWIYQGKPQGPFPLRRQTTTVSITVRPSAVTVPARNSSARSMQ